MKKTLITILLISLLVVGIVSAYGGGGGAIFFNIGKDRTAFKEVKQDGKDYRLFVNKNGNPSNYLVKSEHPLKEYVITSPTSKIMFDGVVYDADMLIVKGIEGTTLSYKIIN